MTPEQFTNRDLFVQMMGFTPTALATRYEQQRAIKDHEGAIMQRRSNLMNSLFLAAKNNDTQEVKDVMARINAFNKANPISGLMINNKSIMQSAKVRAAYDARTINGTAVNKNLHYLHDQYQFVDREEE